jgi:hypothetical protein
MNVMNKFRKTGRAAPREGSVQLTEHNGTNIKRPHFVKCGERGDVTASRPADRKFGEWLRNAIFCIQIFTCIINSLYPKAIFRFMCSGTRPNVRVSEFGNLNA